MAKPMVIKRVIMNNCITWNKQKFHGAWMTPELNRHYCRIETTSDPQTIKCFRANTGEYMGTASELCAPKPIPLMEPTYYVRHPDDSYSVADPQPSVKR